MFPKCIGTFWSGKLHANACALTLPPKHFYMRQEGHIDPSKSWLDIHFPTLFARSAMKASAIRAEA